MEIKTKRLQLRELFQEDTAAIHEFTSIPDALKYEAWGPFSLDEAKGFVSNAISEATKQPRSYYQFVIALKDKPNLIGLCALEIAEGKPVAAKISYSIHPNHRKKGYATEAALGLLDFAQQNLKIRNFHTSCDSENKPSLRILQKCGFTEIGMNAELEQVKGRFRDMLLFELERPKS